MSGTAASMQPGELPVLPDLRPAQEDALEAIEAFMAGPEHHGIVQMFCGTGKSRVMLELVERDFAKSCSTATSSMVLDLATTTPGSTCAIVVPSIALITQFARDYVLKYGVTERCDVMCICSENELPRHDPNHADIAYTTSKERICHFLQQQQERQVRHDPAAAFCQPQPLPPPPQQQQRQAPRSCCW